MPPTEIDAFCEKVTVSVGKLFLLKLEHKEEMSHWPFKIDYQTHEMHFLYNYNFTVSLT